MRYIHTHAGSKAPRPRGTPKPPKQSTVGHLAKQPPVCQQIACAVNIRGPAVNVYSHVSLDPGEIYPHTHVGPKGTKEGLEE
jgi:hypothetical protein